MKEITLDEFVRRIKRLVQEHPDSRFCSFLGAGSSRSSGIPMAGQLVEQWLPKLKELKTGSRDDVWLWANTQYPKAKEQPSSYYGQIVEALFHTPQERQQEIERIITGKDPSFGYAVLGMLMSHKRFGQHLNMVITTNFDDMVADALYLYTQKKPLVITHEALSGFVRPSRSRPLVVKIHGDAQLAPKNTVDETNLLDTKMKRAVQRILRDTGLIFTGYAGADESIVKFLDETDTDALPWGIYWVNTNMPASKTMCEWLEKRQAVWVKHLDFDQLMLAMWQVFELEHPDMSRFDTLKKTYEQTFEELRGDVEARAKKNPEALRQETALLEGLKRAGDELNWWDIALEAERYKDIDPKKAEAIYREGIKKFPNSAPLVGNYAIFLKNIHKDYNQAEVFYKQALKLEPDEANFLGSYANFLTHIRKKHDEAEVFYKQALKLEPDLVANMGNYAIFLTDIRKKLNEAETIYKQILELAPDDINCLGNYAKLKFVLGEDEVGKKLLNEVDFLVKETHSSLNLEIWFYKYAHVFESEDSALQKLKKLLTKGVRSPGWVLSNNVEVAIRQGHTHPELLSALAKVISDKEKIETLESFPAWQELG